MIHLTHRLIYKSLYNGQSFCILEASQEECLQRRVQLIRTKDSGFKLESLIIRAYHRVLEDKFGEGVYGC